MLMFNIYDPDGYLDGPPHEVFTELRRTQPVFFQEMPDEPGYWAVLKHADVIHVAREPVLFSASEGGVVLENLAPDALESMRMMLLAMDPPRHVDYRRPLAPSFKARVMAQLEDRIRSICREIMARAAEQRDVEFVHDVTAPLPTQVIGELMGLPREDWEMLHALAERQTRSSDPDAQSTGPMADDDTGSWAIDMAMYGIQFAQARRAAEPRDDVTSLILATDFNGHPMNDIEFGSFFVQLVTAGNDTTQGMLSNGLLAFFENPDQLERLRDDPSLTTTAVEEILRYESPLHYFRRTATADTEIRGVRDRRRGQGRDDVHVGQPRRGRVRRPADVRYPAQPEPALVVRHRRALLPRRPPGPSRRPRVLRRAARHVPHHRAHRRPRAVPVQPQQRLERPPRSPHTQVTA